MSRSVSVCGFDEGEKKKGVKITLFSLCFAKDEKSRFFLLLINALNRRHFSNNRGNQ